MSRRENSGESRTMKKLIAVLLIVASGFLIAAASADARVVVGTRVYIGPGWGLYWGPYWGPWGYPYPYYPYPYPYPAYPPAYVPPPVAEPQSYIQQVPAIESAPPAPSYWYYCESAKAYYPYVKECPDGWMTVVPPSAPEPR